MKANKKKKRNKPACIPEFCDVNMPHIYNLGLALYGGKVGRRQDVIKLYDRITDWREQLPERLVRLRESGYDEATLKRFSANEEARIAWCIYMEEAMMRNDAEFFETLAALIRHKLGGKQKAHPAEYQVWSEFLRLLRANERLSEDGKHTVAPYPTKGTIRAAVEKQRSLVTNWPRIWKRLKLEWLPVEKCGPRKR